MEFDYYSPSETFVVLTADQFVGRDDGLLEQQKQDSLVCRRNGTFSLRNCWDQSDPLRSLIILPVLQPMSSTVCLFFIIAKRRQVCRM